MEKLVRDLKKINKMKKGDVASVIYDTQEETIKFFIKRSHNRKVQETTLAKLYKIMADEKFVKGLKAILKKGKKDKDIVLDPGYAVIINGFLEENNRSKLTEDTEILDGYYEVIDKLLLKKAEKIASKCDLDAKVVEELLLIAPSKEYISDKKFVGIYSQKMLRKLYILAQSAEENVITDTKQIKRLFKGIFDDKDLIDVIAINILLEKKEFIKNYNEKQVYVWNRMTDFALDTIEKRDKDVIKSYIKYYIDRRMSDERKGKDAARRINLKSVMAENYPKIAKVVSKLPEKAVKYL